MVDLRLDDWFLTPDERGNPATALDRRPGGDVAWTEGNHVNLLIDGATYFRCLHERLLALGPGDSVHLTDWEGDGDERLDGSDSEVGPVLASLSRRGVDVRGLLWRSHPRQAHFAEQSNAATAKVVNAAGGEIVLDERVRRGGSHHQKLVVTRRRDPDDAVAFVGGIDLCRGRNDDARHEGDPQPVPLDDRYGPRPPWHDIQVQVRGPAVADLAFTFRERWQDPTQLDHRNPLRMMARRVIRQPRQVSPLEPVRATPAPCGSHAVQVIRTYPAKRPPFPFAPMGERSIARAYLKAFGRARRLVYIEDQYLWSAEAATALANALQREPTLQVVIVVPRYPDRGGKATSAAARLARERVTEILHRSGGDRVAVYDLENGEGTPIYVHAKVCIVDDVVVLAGSDNINRRSWTHDSEVSCSVIDADRDERAPADPAGLGDGARRFARDARLHLWREHLGRRPGDDADLLDPASGFVVIAESARVLDEWHQRGRIGPRPPGQLRPHRPERVSRWARLVAMPLYRSVLDPDGRPRSLRRADAL